MMDISHDLKQIMKTYHCSSMPAFLILMEEGYDGIHSGKSKSEEQIDGGLCDKSDKPCRRGIMG